MPHLSCEEAVEHALEAITRAKPPGSDDGRDSLRYAAAASEAVAYAQIAIAAALHATPPVNGDTGSLLAGLDRIAVALEASIIDLHAIRVAVEKIAARDGDGSDKPPKPPKKP